MTPGILGHYNLGHYSVFISIQLCRWWLSWFRETALRSEGSHGEQIDVHRIVGGTGITSFVHPIVTDGSALPVPSGSRSREGESGGPFALLAPLGVVLLVLTLPLLPFLEGPFAGVIQ